MVKRDMFYFADIDEKFILQDYAELKKYKSLCRDLKDFYFSRRHPVMIMKF